MNHFLSLNDSIQTLSVIQLETKKICNRENLKIHYTLTNKTLSGVFWPFSCCKEKKASDKLSLTN